VKRGGKEGERRGHRRKREELKGGMEILEPLLTARG